ncbi:hypothetical protein BJ875DRAFT_526478 [Amylocarpus encephaloides]|uniref:Uncharacterized protein n=1 Tax=Amylocarpus encephaloides TaxID=45428 RepID=A0A9P8C043_9HELO|nr:hypothetical protein BJ875DRAFT_526478 [Amylocarpus encephaloides]
MTASDGLDVTQGFTTILGADDQDPSTQQHGVGWTTRPFHPKFDGHKALKESFIQQMKDDEIPSVKKAEVPSPPTTPPPPQEKHECNRLGSNKFLFNEYTVWGHGQVDFQGFHFHAPRGTCSSTLLKFSCDRFDGADHGDALKGEWKGWALLPDAWHFDCGNGDDGREWTARFRTGVFQKKSVGYAARSAGAPNDDCSGSG